MMDSLFAKIDAIQLDPTTLPEEDQAAVDRLTDQLRERLADLDAAKATLENLPTDSEWLNEKGAALLKDLAKERTETREQHLAAVVEHFNTRHDLRLHTPHNWGEQTKELPDDELTRHAVDWVLEQLGGRSFLDIATDKLKTEFQQATWRVKRSRRHVTLNNFVYVQDDFGGKKSLAYHSREKLACLTKAITRFERDTTRAPSGLQQRLNELLWHWSEPQFGESIPTSLQRCTEIVIYKNGNARLTFSDETQAAAFITFYELKLAD